MEGQSFTDRAAEEVSRLTLYWDGLIEDQPCFEKSSAIVFSIA